METIEQLLEKYKTNPYMYDKLTQYIEHLPMLMESIEDHHNKKLVVLQELNTKKDNFIQDFLNKCSVFYIPQTELYIEYKDNNYSILSEDDIVHYILSELNTHELKMWKYKIKKHLLKRIKENQFTTSIPESVTIKSVFQSLSMFESKNHIKYFLTIIGDCLLGKKDSFIYFIDSSYKKFVRKITEQIYLMTNKSVNDIFKYKYWEHNYDNCRVITGKCPELFQFPSTILNIICVATYLSNKYTNSEQFLSQCKDEHFIKKTLFLKMNSSEQIITDFVDECTTKTGTTGYKEIYFLWRSYLKEKNLPLIISDINFKSILTKMNLYKDDVVCVTSKQLYIQNVKLFLKKYLYLEDNMDDLSELVYLYNEVHDIKITEDMFRDIVILLQ
jgi:hypothetical protein